MSVNDSLRIPSRAQLRALVVDWQRGEVSAREVHEQAELSLESFDWQDLPRSDPLSVAYEVLSQLDMLNHQLIVPDDIPAIMAFLESSPDAAAAAWEQWERYWATIDFEERRKNLRGDDTYAV